MIGLGKFAYTVTVRQLPRGRRYGNCSRGCGRMAARVATLEHDGYSYSTFTCADHSAHGVAWALGRAAVTAGERAAELDEARR